MWPLDPPGHAGGPGWRTTLRRWAALLALAGAALPGMHTTREAQATERPEPPPAAGTETGVPPAEVARSASLLTGEPWEAAVVEPSPPEPRAATPAPAAPEEQARSLPGAGLVPQQREYLRPWLIRYAEEYDLPADLIMAQAWKESSWRATAVSEDDAKGVMQLIPATVEFVSRRLLDLDHELDPFDPEANIRMGARYMRHLVDRFDGDHRRALIAYNQGPTSLLANGPYREAMVYADTVLALRAAFGVQ